MISKQRSFNSIITLLLLIISVTPSQIASESNSCCTPVDQYCPTIKSIYPPPQSRFKALKLIGTSEFIHTHEDDTYHGLFATSFAYIHSFNEYKIIDRLFGNDLIVNNSDNSDDCSKSCHPNSLLIQGLAVPIRNDRAWLADYFYLPTDYSSIVSFSPHFTTYLVDLDLYLNFDTCLTGLYLRFSGPLVHTKWSLGMCEEIINAGTTPHPVGYFSPTAISRDKLVSSFTSYAEGNTIEKLTTVPDDALIFHPLQYSRISSSGLTKTGFGELRTEFGWNVWQCGDYHVGINAQVAIPTGPKKNSCYLFAPTVGNGKHWEVGAGATAHYRFYASDNEECSASLVFDINATHLFQTRELRTFELIGRPNSAYMLAAKFGENGANPNSEAVGANGSIGVPSTVASSQFNFEYAPVANLTTMNIKVGIEAMAEITAMLNMKYNMCSFDLGYTFWGHSCETIDHQDPFCSDACRTSLCKTSNKNQWALKGDARMFGFVSGQASPNNGAPVALSGTESKATIHQGTNQVQLNFSALDTNLNIDNGMGNVADEVLDPPVNPPAKLLNRVGGQQINTSIDPILLKLEDIDFLRIRRMSHKVFAHISMSCEKMNWTPFVGIGGFAEFGKNGQCISEKRRLCRSNCINFSISQWGLWLKTGIAFN